MLEQYFGLKREVPDALLLYRLGDFFELFFEDAEIAAPLLGRVLTARHKDSDIEAPMCGIPHHAAEGYIAKLVAAGKKVAIGDQVEPSAKGKTLVARKIVRIVTPGTVTDPERLDARRPNELAAIAWSGAETAISFLDLSTGDWSVLRLPPDSSPEDALGMRLPREVVCFPADREAVTRLLASLPGERPVLSPLASDTPRGRSATDLLLEHFRTGTLDAFGFPPCRVLPRRRPPPCSRTPGEPSARAARTSRGCGPSTPATGWSWTR
jgi:DNA mismatch repair protein MutS